MTDFPAVVYLKAKNPSTKVNISERGDTDCERKDCSKIVRSHKNSIRSRKRIKSYKKLLEALNSVILKKMEKIEGRLDILSDNYDVLEEKVNTLSSYFDSTSYNICETPEQPTGDFPKGSWLGFKNNAEMRVRCRITPKDLQEINRKCITPEKMALALLDNLFDRETQACSNISGLGKHRKKQLDPLLMYGIRCHLMYRFDITDEDWTKMKIHMDSKCRSAFRRKLKGMPIRSTQVICAKTSDTSNYIHAMYRDFNSF